ncbi:hypothetical protein [Campylobacter sp.]|uniref:hypothetical protein n=1 Tax=Campylobacter sp. TaxID=205 RepID=UPI0026DA932C|nr:hypothetical protein [Campylobacter sp.]MDO4674089.1 hypothetical protein [Campylobacter sp.]
MRGIFFLLFALPLFGVRLIDYNIYDRNDRVDLMLSFDGAYEGRISQSKNGDFTLLSFENLEAKNDLKTLNSKLVDKIQITHKDNKTFIMFQNKKKLDFSISSVNDKFGVRIRALPAGKILSEKKVSVLDDNQTLTQAKNPNLKDYDYTTYILVVLVLVLLLFALWWLKRTKGGESGDFRLKFQRGLDRNNRLMVLDYENKRYVLIVGASNLLLESRELLQDERTEDKEKNFDSFFEENKRKIQNLILERQRKT